MSQLSVIVPLAEHENAWQILLADLAKLPSTAEVIFTTAQQKHPISTTLLNQTNWHLLTRQKSGRARQMNAGAQIAKGTYLWFLHADSRFDDNTLAKLSQALSKKPNQLLYFNLAFYEQTICLKLTAWGANWRSRYLSIPFGDQGFCLRKTQFIKIGTFDEQCTYGEDHLLVWQARAYGIGCQAVGARLYTSGRKYQNNGWLKTTLTHQFLWLKQLYYQWRKTKKIT